MKPFLSMKSPLLFLLALLATSFATAQIQYPQTKKVAQVDTLHGMAVADPYRWFENDTTADVKAWVKAQNAVTFGYLDKIPYRKQLRERIGELENYVRYSQPRRVGDSYFFYKNTGKQPQYVLYVQKGINGTPSVFVDANLLAKDGTTRVGLSGDSKDERYVALTTQRAGSDWREITVMEVATKRHLPDTLRWASSGGTWRGDGFYYSRYPEPEKGKELTARHEFQKVYYHRLGQPQSADQLIYDTPKEPLRYNDVDVSEDKRWLFIYSFSGNQNVDIYCQDLTKPGSKLALLIKGKDYISEGIVDTTPDGKFLVQTNRDTPNSKVVLIDPANPAEANWRVVIPEKSEVLEYASTASGKLFATYIKDATSRAYQYNYAGKLEREIKLPDLGVVYGLGGKRDDPFVFYTFESYLYPRTIFKYDIATGQSAVFKKSDVPFRTEDFETRQVFYPSKDGTKIPMFLITKKGLPRNGTAPALLTAYGGYAISVTPYFAPARLLALAEQGMVCAVANIRGGGEYGEKWHQAGMKLNTQNRFDDFIAAGEYLVKEGYAAKDKLAMTGGSHGGCLVGTVMTQRPDLFKVALPAVGTLDMLRFHKFTHGWNWQSEYGRPDSLQDFKLLYGYSPVHNVKAGTRYPATMVITADHDDRVVPMHSFKFISELQAKQNGPNPVLIRIDTNSGHGSSSFLKYLDDTADAQAFMLANIGLTPTFSAKPIRTTENKVGGSN